jgi:hypothetical protein
MTQALIKYEAACYAIAECVRVDEVKEWADKAAAMQAYGRMAKDQTLQAQAAEIRIRAERRLGELITAQKAEGGLNRGAAGLGINQHTPKEVPSLATRAPQTRAPALAEAGISYDLSSRAQRLAAVPEQVFEAELAAKRERDLKDGARVSARLEAAGAKVLKQQTAQEAEAARQAEEAHGDLDTVAALEEALREIEALTGEVKAAEADDLKAEAIKWRRAYDHAVRQQSEAMDRAKESTDREKWVMRQLMRCGKAVGQEDPSKIAAAVEAVARQQKVAA